MPRDTYILLRAFVDELHRCGMQAACTAPGSRSTPLVLSLVRDGRLRCYSHLDERVAGFFAVGLAKASGRPVAVACTSGTAAVELAPAVYEAREARVPLVVLTADRPPELRDVGAGQTVDQLKLYGDAAKWFVEVGTHEATPARLRWIRTLACRAFWTASTGRRGPVHLNVPLREPLVLDEGEALPPDDSGRPGGRPWVAHAQAAARPAQVTLGRRARGSSSPAATSATRHCPRRSRARRSAAATRCWPTRSRAPGAAARRWRTTTRCCATRPSRPPTRPTSCSASATCRRPSRCASGWPGRPTRCRSRLDPEEGWQDPDGVVETMLVADPRGDAGRPRRLRRPGLAALVARRRRGAATAIAATLGDALSEPLVAAQLGADLPPTATCFVASSMPVRDVETFWPARDAPPRALSHRGANGIDGTVSGALGAAAAGAGPVVLLIGDVALAYDLGALASAARLGLSLTIVLLNNDGGGIFSFLPVARERDAFEEHVATPHGLDFARAAALYGCAYTRADDPAALRTALDAAGDGVTLIEVRTDRDENVALHRRVWAAVADALSAR